MNVEEIKEQLHTTPFEPFKIHLSNGHSFEVKHHDDLLLSRTAVHLATDFSGVDDVAERIVRISLLHITHLEPMLNTSGLASS